MPLVTEKLPNYLRLLMARKFKNEKWGNKEMLEILKDYLEDIKILITVGSFFNNTFEKNHSTSALQ